MKTPYLPKDDSSRAMWLSNFAAQLGPVAASVGISAGEVTETQTDADYFSYELDAANKFNQYGIELTAYKNALRDNPGVPTGPLPAPPTAQPGIFPRVSALVQRIKASNNYTETIGQALGIIGTDIVIDFTSMTPQLTALLGSAGKPKILLAKEWDARHRYLLRSWRRHIRVHRYRHNSRLRRHRRIASRGNERPLEIPRHLSQQR